MRIEVLERLELRAAAFSELAAGDMGLKDRTDPGPVMAARRAFAGACGLDGTRLVCAQQVHGTQVACVGEVDAGRGAASYDDALPSTDGLITDTPGLPLAILTADCVPVFLYDPKRRACGVLHAGREGTVGNICGEGVARLKESFGCGPVNIHAWIGPSAGPCCYEVSREMAQAFGAAGLPVSGRHLDLWEANAVQLRASGLRAEHITLSGACTICDERFHSYRRTKTTARNMALIAL